MDTSVRLSVDWENILTRDSIYKRAKSLFRMLHDQPNPQHPGEIQTEKSVVDLSSGATYTGTWDSLGLAGEGRFTFTMNAIYEGEFYDGKFHGHGDLFYPMGHQVIGKWGLGRLVSFKLKFEDGLEYEEPSLYCKFPDRRYYTCILTGLRPAGRSLLTNKHPPRVIPPNCYDTGDGFYDPSTMCVMSANNPGKVIRIPTIDEEEWIIKHCRKAWDESSGYRPDLYEHWTTGRRSEIDAIIHQSSELDSDDYCSSCSDDMPIVAPPASDLSIPDTFVNFDWEESEKT